MKKQPNKRWGVDLNWPRLKSSLRSFQTLVSPGNACLLDFGYYKIFFVSCIMKECVANDFILVTLTKKHEHISPVLKDIHWLAFDNRIVYILMLLTLKALNNQAPQYLRDLISIKQPSRSLRSNESIFNNSPYLLVRESSVVDSWWTHSWYSNQRVTPGTACIAARSRGTHKSTHCSSRIVT